MQHNTNQEFLQVIDTCREIFGKKLQDYHAAWRILRLESLTDQLYIKIMRIRSIQTKKEQKVDENISSEFIALINYSIVALIQMDKGHSDSIDMDTEEAVLLYNKYANEALELMKRKNHDYGEAWRQMRISGITDLILMKIFRIRQIEENEGKTIMSEGVDANYYDIINYSVFALIKLSGS